MKTYEECKNEVARSEGRCDWAEFINGLKVGIESITIQEAYWRVADLYAKEVVMLDRRRIADNVDQWTYDAETGHCNVEREIMSAEIIIP